MAVIGKIFNPVVVIAYNRPQYIKKLLNKLIKFNCSTIYIISDGPKNNPLDIKLVKKTRYLIDKILVNKKKIKIYSDYNLGLRKRVITGLNYVFKIEKQAIILEDDCIPTKEFFKFIDIMLCKFKNEKNIASICGSNHLSKWNLTNSNYIISKYFNSWGWATWSDRWLNINLNTKYLLNSNNNKKILDHLGSYRSMLYWRFKLKKILNNKISSWAYTYNYYHFLKKNYHIITSHNLIQNIGIGKNSTNTKNLPIKYFVQKLKIKHKPTPKSKIYLDRQYDKVVEDKVFSKSIYNRIKWLLGIKI